MVETGTQSSHGKLGSLGSPRYDPRVEYMTRHGSANRGLLVSSSSLWYIKRGGPSLKRMMGNRFTRTHNKIHIT